MGPERNNKQDARDQVDAFMEILKERLEIDEEKMRRMAEIGQKNGKTYVTWAWIITVLLVLVSFLASRQLSNLEQNDVALRNEVFDLRAKQADVRERLKALEETVHRFMERQKP